MYVSWLHRYWPFAGCIRMDFLHATFCIDFCWADLSMHFVIGADLIPSVKFSFCYFAVLPIRCSRYRQDVSFRVDYSIFLCVLVPCCLSLTRLFLDADRLLPPFPLSTSWTGRGSVIAPSKMFSMREASSNMNVTFCTTVFTPSPTLIKWSLRALHYIVSTWLLCEIHFWSSCMGMRS